MFASPILKEKLRFFKMLGGGDKKIKLKLRYNFYMHLALSDNYMKNGQMLPVDETAEKGQLTEPD